MDNTILFFDTYAFFEVIRGNKNYAKYITAMAVTTIFNLAELNYGLKKEMSSERADGYTTDYWQFITDITLEDIKEAMSLKLKNKELSIPDVIGYTVAKRLGIKFLTGDKEFKNIPCVEFVK